MRRASWHWFFLIQPSGFPERLIGSEAEFFLRHQLGGLLREPAKLEPEAFADYLRCFRNPDTIRATCDEYRAGATIDLVHDRADRGRRIAIPLLMLWGQHSSQAAVTMSSPSGAIMPRPSPATPSTAAISSPKRRPRTPIARSGTFSRQRAD